MKLPDSWHKRPLGELFKKIVVGYVGNVNDHYCDASRGIPFYRTLNIRDGYFRHDEIRHVTKEFNDKNKKSQIENDDIVIARVGANLGMVCKVSGLNGMANMANAIIIKNKSARNASSDFYTYFLLSPFGKSQIYAGAAGGAQGVFNTKLTQEISVPVPPLPEQKKIAKILSTWDKAITITEQLLANSQQQKKALMQQLLTGKKRLLDENGVRFSGEWKDIRLKSVLREVKTRNKDNSIDRVLSVTNHSGFVLPEDQFSKRVASDDVSNYKVVKKGEYGYNPSRLNVGSFARLDSYEEGLLSPMYVVFSVNEKILNSDYFMNWMSSNEAKQRISGSTQGSVRDSVGFDSLCGFPFKLPPMAEQQKIAAVLSAADQEVTTLQKKLEALKQEKKALMQQLLTGKRRVKIDNKEVA